jgi:hypothetical protein
LLCGIFSHLDRVFIHDTFHACNRDTASTVAFLSTFPD